MFGVIEPLWGADFCVSVVRARSAHLTQSSRPRLEQVRDTLLRPGVLMTDKDELGD